MKWRTNKNEADILNIRFTFNNYTICNVINLSVQALTKVGRSQHYEN